MTGDARDRPWERLAQLAESGDGEAIERLLDELPGGEVARALSRLSSEQQGRVLAALAPHEAAGVIEDMPDAHAAGVVEELPARQAAAIIAEMPSAQRADLMAAIESPSAEAILAEMSPEAAADVRALARYAPDVAGGLMVTELVSFPESASVGDVVAGLQAGAERYADYDVQYVYVVGRDGRLAGVLRLRDLLLAPPARPVASLMIRDARAVRDDTPLPELHEFFTEHQWIGAPVVDRDGRLVGVVKRHDVQAAIGDQAGSAFMRSQGILGGEELRTMPFVLRSRRRLAWLTINIGLNLIAASVIAAYQETLSAVIALAIFLPIISDMSGCSGNQAVAVSIRELALGLVRPRELLRVMGKEITVGVVNGVILGAVIALIAWGWQGNPWLGAVVGAALAVNTVVAVSVGGTLPLLLERLRVDPALAAGPVLTTLTDMCGFFLVLSLATLALSRLTAG